MLDEKLLRSEEAAVFRLRDLYRRHGYLPYRMSKFEEYELYVRNKDFLVSTASLPSMTRTESFWHSSRT